MLQDGDNWWGNLNKSPTWKNRMTDADTGADWSTVYNFWKDYHLLNHPIRNTGFNWLEDDTDTCFRRYDNMGCQDFGFKSAHE